MKRTAANGMKRNRGSVLVLSMVFMVMIMFLAGVFLQLTTVNIKSVVKEAERIKASWIARAGISQQIHDLRAYYFLYQYRVSKDVPFAGGQYSIGSLALIGRGYHYSLLASLGEYPVSTSTVTDSSTARFAETARLEMNATTDFAEFQDVGTSVRTLNGVKMFGPMHINGYATVGKTYGACCFVKDGEIFGPVIDVSQKINVYEGDPLGQFKDNGTHVLFAETGPQGIPDPFDAYYNYTNYKYNPESWPGFSRVFFEAKSITKWQLGPYDAKKNPCAITKTADDGTSYSYNLLVDKDNGGKTINVPTMANISYKNFAHLITPEWTLNWSHPVGKVTKISNYEIQKVPGQTDASPLGGLTTFHWWGPALNLGTVQFQTQGFNFDIPVDRDLAYVNVAMMRYNDWPNLPNLPIGYGQNADYSGANSTTTDYINDPGNLPPTCVSIDYPSRKLNFTYPLVWGWWRFNKKPGDTGQKWRGRRYVWTALSRKSSVNGYSDDRVVDNATDQVFTLRGDQASRMDTSSAFSTIYHLSPTALFPNPAMTFSWSNNPPNDGTYPNAGNLPATYAVGPGDTWEDYNTKNRVRIRLCFGCYNGVKIGNPADYFIDEWKVVPISASPLYGTTLTCTGEDDSHASLESVYPDGTTPIFNLHSAVVGCDFSNGDIVFAKTIGGSQRGAVPGRWSSKSGNSVSGSVAWPSYVNDPGNNNPFMYVRVEALWSHDFPTNLSVWLHDTVQVIKYDLSKINEDNCPRPQIIGDLNDPIEKQKYGVVYCQVPVALYGVPKVPVTIFCEDDVYVGAINQTHLDGDSFWDTSKLHTYSTKAESTDYQPVAIISKGLVFSDYSLAPQYETTNYRRDLITCNYFVGEDTDLFTSLRGQMKYYYPKKLAVFHLLWSTDYNGDDEIQYAASCQCLGRGNNNPYSPPIDMYNPIPYYYGSYYQSTDPTLYAKHKYLNRMCTQSGANKKFNFWADNNQMYTRIYNKRFRTNPPPHVPCTVNVVSHNIMYEPTQTQAFIENLQNALNTQDGLPDYSDASFVNTLHDLLTSIGE